MQNALFQIGFNKTATTALFWLFVNSGHECLHSAGRRNRRLGHPLLQQTHAQLIIHHNIIAGLPPCQGFETVEAFFDMEFDVPEAVPKIENYKHFDRFARAYPDAKFLLNIRDRDAWVRSRSRHNSGKYLKRNMSRYNLSAAQVQTRWADEFDRHTDAVRAFFASEPDRLLEFNVDQDPIDKVAAFAAPEFTLDAAHWSHARVTDTVEEKKKQRRAATARKLRDASSDVT